MKNLLMLVIILMTTSKSFAQSELKVSGNLMNDKSEAVPFANVLLINPSDSSMIKAAMTDTDGKFTLEIPNHENYKLRISAVGFKDYYSNNFNLTSTKPKIDFGKITLATLQSNLHEVTVTAKKPFIEQQLDKTVLNVENSIVSSGNTAIEILEKAPGVVIDRQNDQIKLKNKTGVLVMIDGRKNYLSAEALMTMLNNMSADNVASIEIITNPSSKYEASGNSGIINIKLKKNKAFGTNGSISVGLGKSFIPFSDKDLFRETSNLSLNHRQEKWNFYSNSAITGYTYAGDNSLNRVVNYESTRTDFNQYSFRNGKGVYWAQKLGVDYNLSKKTTLGIMLDVNNSGGSMQSSGLTNVSQVSSDNTINSSLIPNMKRNDNDLNFSGNFNIKHNFDDKGKEMTFDMDYSGFRNDATTIFDTHFYNNLNVQDSLLLQNQTAPTNIDIYASKIDFVLPLKNKAKFEYGAKFSLVKTDNDFKFDVFKANNWQSDPGKTNHFIYKENVNAIYANFGKSWEKINFQVGLRAEQTHSDGNSVTLSKQVKRDYINLFPTFFLNQELNKNNSIRYSYSRRIDRPSYQQLNPFIFFLDPYTYNIGNAFLQPQYTDNIELTYTYKSAYSLALGYSNTQNSMFQVIQQNDSTKSTYQTTVNLSKVENYSATLSFPVSVTKWWNMQNNFSYYYNSYKDPNLSGGNLNVGRWAYNFNISNTYTLKKNWSGELSMWFNSPNVYGMMNSLKPQYALNFGLQKTFLNKKAKLKLNVNDLFLTSFFKGSINYQNVDMNISSRWSSRRAMLTFTYNFGNQNVKGASRRSTATDDLKNRAGGAQQ